MKRIQIDLDSATVEVLTELAAEHGHRLKPFIEYVLKLQARTVKPPTVQPVVIPQKEAANRKPPKVEPLEVLSVQVPVKAKQPKEEPQEDTVKAADKEGRFLKRLGRWTNGKCYRKETEEGAFIYSYV